MTPAPEQRATPRVSEQTMSDEEVRSWADLSAANLPGPEEGMAAVAAIFLARDLLAARKAEAEARAEERIGKKFHDIAVQQRDSAWAELARVRAWAERARDELASLQWMPEPGTVLGERVIGWPSQRGVTQLLAAYPEPAPASTPAPEPPHGAPPDAAAEQVLVAWHQALVAEEFGPAAPPGSRTSRWRESAARWK